MGTGKFQFNIDPDNTADIRQLLPTAEATTTELNLSNGRYLATAGAARGLSYPFRRRSDTNIYR